MPQDIAGRKVLNRYKIVEKIGGGGMSVVWKAYDLVLDRSVALKILRPEMSEDEDFIRRFRREAQSVASLSHPSIVNIYDVGEDHGLYFIVMELIGKGETLRDLLRAKGRLPVARSLEIASEICEALAHAHGKRIIHRDIKPQNILLTEEGRAKVADFGIARALGSLSTTTRDMVVGSAPYISPEQAKNGTASLRSDLYSLGVVLYEMLSGKQPFAGDSPVAVALQHVEADPPSLRENAPSIPLVVDQLVMKAMAKDPSQRFQSAEEMLAAIRAFQTGSVEPPTREAVRGDAPPSERGDAKLAKGRTKRQPLSLAMKLFLGLAAITVVAVVYALVAFDNYLSRPEVVVPEVAGKPQIEAQAVLKEVGLNLAVSGYKYDANVPAGTVLTQSPSAGEKVKEGRDVWCLLSRGQEYAKVPDVVGKTYPIEVVVLFENAGVQEGKVTFSNHPDIPKGKVMSQQFPGGMDVPIGSTVDLTVSAGPEKTATVVPDLTGMSLSKVADALTEALLDQGVVMYQPLSTAPAGTVIGQDPAPGTEVSLRTKVTVIVAGTAPALGRRYNTKFTPRDLCADGKPTRVTITVRDSRQTDIVVYDMTVAPTDPEQTVEFLWQGSQAVVTTKANGEVISRVTIRP